MLVEVDMEPFAAGGPCLAFGDLHDLGSDSAVSRAGGDHRVLQPRMHKAIPEHVDESDESVVVSGRHPPETGRSRSSTQFHSAGE